MSTDQDITRYVFICLELDQVSEVVFPLLDTIVNVGVLANGSCGHVHQLRPTGTYDQTSLMVVVEVVGYQQSGLTKTAEPPCVCYGSYEAPGCDHGFKFITADELEEMDQ